MIYLDNAATTLKKPETVARAVFDAIATVGNSGRGAGAPSLAASELVYETRALISELFNVGKAENVAFALNATDALNIAINGLFTQKDHIITTAAEHNSVLRPIYALGNYSIAPCDESANIDYAAMEGLIRPDTRGIVCTHCSNLTGNITDLERVSEICKRNGLLFVLDTAQSAGVLDIDMQKYGIDALCFTGHKSLYGIQGTGGICIRDGLEIRPFRRGGSGIRTFDKEHPEVMPTRLEAGTLNAHGIAGLNAGVKFVLETGTRAIREKLDTLTKRLYEGLKEIEGVTVYGDFSGEHGAVVSMNMEGISSEELSYILDEEYGIVTRAGGHCAPLMHEHLGTRESGALRFSMSYFNSDDEIEETIKAVKELAESV